MFDQIDSCFGEHFLRQSVGIAGLIVYLFYSGVDNHFGANGTGLIGAVKHGVFYRNAVIRCLYDGILLGMYPAAQFMALARGNLQGFPQATNLQTMSIANMLC